MKEERELKDAEQYEPLLIQKENKKQTKTTP